MKIVLYVWFALDLLIGCVLSTSVLLGLDVSDESVRWNGVRLLIEIAALAVIHEIGKREVRRHG